LKQNTQTQLQKHPKHTKTPYYKILKHTNTNTNTNTKAYYTHKKNKNKTDNKIL